MLNAFVPPFVARAVALVVFVLPLALIGVHTAFAAWGTARGDFSPRARLVAPLAVAAFLATWLALGLILGDVAHFPMANGNLRRLLSLLVGFGPVVVAVLLLVWSRTTRALYGAMPPEWLIGVQLYRVAGGIFLYPLLYYGALPAGFAVPAAVGDMLTGILAPVVASGVRRRRSHAILWAVAWNLFGILDLIVAPVEAVRWGARVLDLFPVSLVPLFIGPPLGILMHIYSLRNLSGTRHLERAPAPGARAGVDKAN